MINPHPRAVAADFEAWCLQSKSIPGEPGFQPSLAAAIQNAVIGYIRGSVALQCELVEDLQQSAFMNPAPSAETGENAESMVGRALAKALAGKSQCHGDSLKCNPA